MNRARNIGCMKASINLWLGVTKRGVAVYWLLSQLLRAKRLKYTFLEWKKQFDCFELKWTTHKTGWRQSRKFPYCTACFTLRSVKPRPCDWVNIDLLQEKTWQCNGIKQTPQWHTAFLSCSKNSYGSNTKFTQKEFRHWLVFLLN